MCREGDLKNSSLCLCNKKINADCLGSRETTESIFSKERNGRMKLKGIKPQ